MTLNELLTLAQEEEDNGKIAAAKLLFDRAIRDYETELTPEQRERIAHHSAALLGDLLAQLPRDGDEDDEGILTFEILPPDSDC
jgi:hypothetical protein